MFMGAYDRTMTQGDNRVGPFKLQNIIPSMQKLPQIPEEVEELSGNFSEVYKQAFIAESYGLNEIAGVGYRKALEFLIKDYSIHKNTDAEQNIKSLQLAKVIGQYVEDVNIKECAKRAVWLGNDETHYVRKWESKDISDLKILIKLTMGWVCNCLLTQKYIADMA